MHFSCSGVMSNSETVIFPVVVVEMSWKRKTDMTNRRSIGVMNTIFFMICIVGGCF